MTRNDCDDKTSSFKTPFMPLHLRHHRTFRQSTLAVTIFVVVLCLYSPLLATSCPHYGSSDPLGDITGDSQLEEGSPFDLVCSLAVKSASFAGNNRQPIDARNIKFEFNGEFIDQSRVRTSPDLRSATVSFKETGVQMSDSGSYYCYVVNEVGNHSLVCSMHLEVGRRPSRNDPISLDCVSESYENLTCSWLTPDYKTPTTTALYVSYGNKMGASCPITINATSCMWTTTSESPYRQFSKKLHFILRVNNKYGNISFPFTLDHFSIVRPGHVVEPSIIDVTPTSVAIDWKKPTPFDYLDSDDHLSPHIAFNVKVVALKTGLVVNETNTTDTSISISNLTPFIDYRFLITSFTEEATNRRFWSNETVITMTTKADVPDKSPTLEKAFESVNVGNGKRHVRVYWKPLPKDDMYGPGGHYIIRVSSTRLSLDKDGRRKQRHVNSIEDGKSLSSVGSQSPYLEYNTSWASFSFQFSELFSLTPYVFRLYSANRLGVSPSFTSMVIEEDTEAVDGSSDISLKPINVEAYYLDVNRYEVRWKEVKMNKEVSGYTISWCPYNVKGPGGNFKCIGALNSSFVSSMGDAGHPRWYNIETPAHEAGFQFGVSVNLKDNTSTPVTWAACVVPINDIKRLERIHVVHTKAINSTAIRVFWKLNCPGLHSVISKFEVTYCPSSNLIDRNLTRCDQPLSKVQVMGGDKEEVILSGLSPRTPYRLTLRAFTGVNETLSAGDESEVMVEITMKEDVPLYVTLLSFLAILLAVVFMVGLTSWGYMEWKKLREEMGIPIQLPGRLAGEKVDLNKVYSTEGSRDDVDGHEGSSLYRQISVEDADDNLRPIFRRSSSSDSTTSTDDLLRGLTTYSFVAATTPGQSQPPEGTELLKLSAVSGPVVPSPSPPSSNDGSGAEDTTSGSQDSGLEVGQTRVRPSAVQETSFTSPTQTTAKSRGYVSHDMLFAQSNGHHLHHHNQFNGQSVNIVNNPPSTIIANPATLLPSKPGSLGDGDISNIHENDVLFGQNDRGITSPKCNNGYVVATTDPTTGRTVVRHSLDQKQTSKVIV